MSERVDRVVDRLVASGISRDSLPAVYFAITTERDRMDNNRVTGYSAQTTLEATTTQLGALAEFLSVALEAGATDVGRIRFGSTESAGAKQEALRLAVQAAENDARTIADARGGRLGRLVEVSSIPPSTRDFGQSLRLDEIVVTGAATTPRQISIQASVTAKWLLH